MSNFSCVKDQLTTGLSESVLERAFSDLVDLLSKLVLAERDVMGLPFGDPAFDRWLSDAEAARAAVVDAAGAVVMLHIKTAAERNFRSVAMHFESLLLTQDAGHYDFTRRFLQSAAWLYTPRGRGPAVMRANALLRAFRAEFGQLMALPDYMPGLDAAADPGMDPDDALSQMLAAA